MIEGIDDIQPKKKKSNLNVKKNKNKRRTSSKSTMLKRAHEKEVTSGADVVFGLDNGATGTIACLFERKNPKKIEAFFRKTPAVVENDYQKSSQKIARIDWLELKKWFEEIIEEAKKIYIEEGKDSSKLKICVVLERPMINAERFKQSKNAARAFESVLMVLEMLGLKNNYIVIDSKKWQHWLFGKNTINLNLKEESKKEGLKFVKALKPKDKKNIEETIAVHGDADGLMIARYAFEKLR